MTVYENTGRFDTKVVPETVYNCGTPLYSNRFNVVFCYILFTEKKQYFAILKIQYVKWEV